MRELDAARMFVDAFCSESLGLFEEEIIERSFAGHTLFRIDSIV
jgi:hypothetical protein